MMESMEKLMESLTMDHNPPPIKYQGKQKRDQDFRGPLPSPRNQIIPRTPLQFKLKEELDSQLVVEEGPLCVGKTKVVAKELQEHTNPSLLAEEEDDKLLKSALPSNPTFHEEYNQQDQKIVVYHCALPHFIF